MWVEGRQAQARTSWWWWWRRPRASGGVMIYEAAVGGGWADCLWLPARTGFF